MIKKSRAAKTGNALLTFALPAAQVHGTVSVVGMFNDWQPEVAVLRRRSNGTVSASVLVAAGERVSFRHLATGGLWSDDAAADVTTSRGSVLQL